MNEAQKQATISKAEEHYTNAMSSVEEAGAAVKEAKTTDAEADVRTAIEDADDALSTARDEIAAAKASIEELGDSEGKTAYLESLAAANEAIDGLQDTVAYLGTATDIVVKVQTGAAAMTKANADLDAAIKAGNSRSYSTMKSKARAASVNYVAAAAAFRDAHQLDPESELDKAARYADKRKEQCDVAVRMAEEGSAGRTSAYNKDVSRMRVLEKDAGRIGEPAIIKDPNWVEKRLADINDAVEAAAQTADELRAKALAALGYQGTGD